MKLRMLPVLIVASCIKIIAECSNCTQSSAPDDLTCSDIQLRIKNKKREVSCVCMNNCLEVTMNCDAQNIATVDHFICHDELSADLDGLKMVYYDGIYTFSCNSDTQNLQGERNVSCKSGVLSANLPMCVDKEASVPLLVVVLACMCGMLALSLFGVGIALCIRNSQPFITTNVGKDNVHDDAVAYIPENEDDIYDDIVNVRRYS